MPKTTDTVAVERIDAAQKLLEQALRELRDARAARRDYVIEYAEEGIESACDYLFTARRRASGGT